MTSPLVKSTNAMFAALALCAAAPGWAQAVSDAATAAGGGSAVNGALPVNSTGGVPTPPVFASVAADGAVAAPSLGFSEAEVAAAEAEKEAELAAAAQAAADAAEEAAEAEKAAAEGETADGAESEAADGTEDGAGEGEAAGEAASPSDPVDAEVGSGEDAPADDGTNAEPDAALVPLLPSQEQPQAPVIE